VNFSLILAGTGAAAALFASVAPASAARAREAIPESATAQTGDDGAALADHPAEESSGGIFIAAAVGEVSVDRVADVPGRKVYADRSQVAGSATVVSFSSSAPRPRLSGSGAGGASAPLARAVVTSRFGALRSQGGGGVRAHAGVDLAAPQGSPVTSALDGRVSVANWSGNYGQLVVVDHPGGTQTRYAHLSRIAVIPGQTVRRGDLLGLVGSTGHSTGPHLHFEVRQDGRAVDPLAQAR